MVGAFFSYHSLMYCTSTCSGETTSIFVVGAANGGGGLFVILPLSVTPGWCDNTCIIIVL